MQTGVAVCQPEAVVVTRRRIITFCVLTIVLVAAMATQGSVAESTEPDILRVQTEGEQALWSRTGSTPLLTIITAPNLPVSVSFRVKLDDLEHAWTVDGLNSGASGVIEMPVEIPRATWLHPTQADYVADLIGMVELDGHRQRTPEAYVAWPDGQVGAPVIWTLAQQRELAPNGVLRAELREGADGPYDRIMPDVSDLAPPRPARDFDNIRDSGEP